MNNKTHPKQSQNWTTKPHKKLNSQKYTYPWPWGYCHKTPAFLLCFLVARSVSHTYWAVGSATAPELQVYKFISGYHWTNAQLPGYTEPFIPQNLRFSLTEKLNQSLNANTVSSYWNKLLLTWLSSKNLHWDKKQKYWSKTGQVGW